MHIFGEIQHGQLPTIDAKVDANKPTTKEIAITATTSHANVRLDLI